MDRMTDEHDSHAANSSETCPSRRADASAVLFALALPGLMTLCYFTWLTGPAAGAVALLGKTVQLAFPMLWVLAAQRRRLNWARPGKAGLAEGAAFGVLVLAAMLLLYFTWLKPGSYMAAAAEQIRRKVDGFGLCSPARYIALGVVYSLGHSLLEEYYWRWFVFGQLRRLVSLRAAIAISSLGFMGHHVVVLSTFFGWFSFAAVFFSLAVAVGGAVWAWIYHRSGSLYAVWLSHLFIDVGIFSIGYHLLFAAQVGQGLP
ncbi:MAG TPA: CPBP family intramembrane glutamic endopeptidase [Thermoguttaceae bacterium]|nr:CPBP family intramembrane glutamic endopeptidase [Thermoguttaceae bacterium]